MLKPLIGLIFCFIITTLSAFGQTLTSGSNQTTSLCGGRWEFFMSDVAVRLTFKIDKFTGDILALVQRKDETLTWELVKREPTSKDAQKAETINYQLFSSGQGIRHTYLLNTYTGASWQLVIGENDVWIFKVVE